MKNPFGRSSPVVDTTPRPGGVNGRIVEYDYVDKVGVDQPKVPYHWGQGFPHEWGHNYMVQWINQPLPYEKYINPNGVTPINHIWPVIKGSDGAWQLQLNEQTAQPTGGTPMALRMMQAGSALQDLPDAHVNVFAFGFARPE